MSHRMTLNVPLNRVEGDLEIRVEIEDGRVVDAWCSGTMYRGLENLLVGRGALDGLVITPRVCGICSTSHLFSAALALDMVTHIVPPPNGQRIRNITLMAEHLQSDVRHTFLMFSTDFTNPAYQHQPLFTEALRRFQPFQGETVIDVIRITKRLLEIIAILGGQWPHSSFMVPGGVTSIPSVADLLQCRLLLNQYRQWYEQRILGCTLERWLEIRSAPDIDVWLDENQAHRDSDLGFFIRYARTIGIDQLGRGPGAYISYGSLDMPAGTQVLSPTGNGQLVPGGFAHQDQVDAFDQAKISEHVAHSWYVDYGGGRHPFEGETRPWGPGSQELKYSWAKAPRYDNQPAETGALAEMVVARQPLFIDLINRDGPTAFVRQLARLIRSCYLIPALETWITEATDPGEFYTLPAEFSQGQGYGLIQATRGALGHWVSIEEHSIRRYQIITPTSWHASPRDNAGIRGPIEQALIGTPVKDPQNPVELGHVVRSFDPCLVCTVHMLQRGQTSGQSATWALL